MKFFSLPLVAMLALIGSTVAPRSDVHAAGTRADDSEEPAPSTAAVSVRILEADGTEVELSKDSVAWSTETDLVATHGEVEHRVSMRVDHKEGELLSVHVGYAKNGSAVIARQSVETKERTPAEIAGPDGHVRLSLVVTPKRPRGKIELPGGNDPLDGLP